MNKVYLVFEEMRVDPLKIVCSFPAKISVCVSRFNTPPRGKRHRTGMSEISDFLNRTLIYATVAEDLDIVDIWFQCHISKR